MKYTIWYITDVWHIRVTDDLHVFQWVTRKQENRDGDSVLKHDFLIDGNPSRKWARFAVRRGFKDACLIAANQFGWANDWQEGAEG